MASKAASADTDIRTKRINTELEQLKGQLSGKYYKWSTFETVQGLYVRVHVDRILVEESIKEYLEERQQEVSEQENLPAIVFKNRDRSLIFDILLDNRYPFNQPQIFCRSAFSSPPLNDGRDVFNEVLKSDWQLTKKLHEIIQYIPEFVADVAIEESETGGGVLIKVLGTFHLGNNYEMSNWGAGGINRESRVFQVEEQDEADEETFYPRLLVITPSALLLLEAVKGSKNVGTLLSWATLQSLDKLRRNLSRPDLVTFVWRHIDGKQPWVLNLMIPGGKHEECIQAIVANMKNMGVGVEKNTKNEKKLNESEVTKEAIARMDVDTILEHIAAYEAALVNDLSLSTVQTLTTLYQKAIEYYSAFDDLLFNDFLNRMQSLLQREDIQAVLNSFDEATPKPPAKAQVVDFNVSDDHQEEEEEVEEYDEEEEEDEEEASQEDVQQPSDQVQIPAAQEAVQGIQEEQSQTHEDDEAKAEDVGEVKQAVIMEVSEEEAQINDIKIQEELTLQQAKEEAKADLESAQEQEENEKLQEVNEKEDEENIAITQHEPEKKTEVKNASPKQMKDESSEDDEQDIDDYLDKIEQD